MTTWSAANILLAIASLAIAACGGKTTGASTSDAAAIDSANDSANDSASDDGASSEAGTPCPATAPRSFDFCDGNAACRYPAAAPGCTAQGATAIAIDATCIAGDWFVATETCSEFPPDYAGPTPSCPAAYAIGGACDVPGLVCAYGDNPYPTCNPQLTCTDGAWVDATKACAPTPTETCPATFDDASMAACSATGAVCIYGDQTCVCAVCEGGCDGTKGSLWTCYGPAPGPACPAAAPDLGTPCAPYGTACQYGLCEANTGIAVRCEAGVWVTDLNASCFL